MISKAPLTPIPLINFIRENASFSRREIMANLKRGRITINDTVIYDANAPITPQSLVKMNGHLITKKKRLYYRFNKPTNVISTFKDPKGRKDLGFFLKKYRLPSTLRPCGRLDRDSSGLLIFSNDGEFINHLLHPSFSVKKTYEIMLDRPLDISHKDQLSKGFFLDDGPVVIQFDSWYSPTHFLVTISIGRNQILRRSFSFFGYTIQVLHRQSIGPIHLNKLPTGEFNEIPLATIKKLALN